jgi:hypothetical protein
MWKCRLDSGRCRGHLGCQQRLGEKVPATSISFR